MTIVDDGADQVELSPAVSDEIKYTTCYMCACRCGIKVHLRDGDLRYIEGNRNHPVNKGVLCAKGSAGIMQHHSPARLSQPLLRVGERGSGEFKAISWDEAMDLATSWLDPIRKTDPRKLAFFTGRDQSQALTGWWASQFGTPNHAAHGGFCSVNMAAAGLYSIGGSFWEFGEPDWDHCRYFMMFGVAEDHDSNPIKTGLAKLKENGAKYVAVNPVRTGYAGIADEWLAVTPGSDGLLVLALVHELLRAGKVDLDYLARYTNAPWLVVENPGGDDDGLFARDDEGNPLCWDSVQDKPVNALSADIAPSLKSRVTLPDGRKAVPVFHLLAERYLDGQYSPDAVADQTGLSGATIRRIAGELAHAAFQEEVVLDVPWTDWAGRHHEQMIGRPVAIHAMRGISAHANGFQTCRSLHLLQMLLGSIDVPGGFRFKPPFPKPAPPGLKPAGKPGQVKPSTPLGGPPLGFPQGPEDLLVEADGTPCRIDHAFSWEAPISAHGMMHTVIANAHRGNPYPIDTLFMYMANMAWNSSMNTTETMDMLTDKDPDSGEYKIPHIIYSDAFYSETVAYADLILPDTTYLERWDCVSMLDRPISNADGPADAIRQPVLTPDRDVRPFQDVLLDLGARLGLPGLLNEDGSPRYPGGYPDYLANHERTPGVGSLAGWRGENGESMGVGAANPDQLARYVENECFWQDELAPEARYFKHGNRDYLDYAVKMGFIGHGDPIVLQLYTEALQKFRLAARGVGAIQPQEQHRKRIEKFFDPLPIWYPPSAVDGASGEDYPLHAISQRPAAMYHSWGSQNAWLRQIHTANRLYISESVAQEHDIADDGWVYLESRHGRIKAQVRIMAGVNDRTVWTWNAIGKRAGAWNLEADAPEAEKGFLLNHLIEDLLPENAAGDRLPNADPITGQAAWFDLRVRISKAPADTVAATEPGFKPLPLPPGVKPRPSILRYGKTGDI
ncbi:MAG: molybdopterin-dependent oxidoreductase [Rhodospirillaceae bacterium]|jgi:sulfite dehydrogenase (quinone) subunit SoeA|nr:molybdopterin-dependent oxidoreductase [Rhodospirillaceae bacterium]MBT4043116.1 molybdopterin-dependent oxidoreductase [Rhodospirillaceae bacterium]MBT4688114.1 molybdopterin-dependent oxidoreductase [Rhodospirillaceae bacterium]MBT5080281.1 molybdopterin-dependent oxidoreductase [Rhodospirillaceae bacterium]MBT5525020.1 molybdopterin-dependent oxidoreductase [Rhodospirillaceae bacterium]